MNTKNPIGSCLLTGCIICPLIPIVPTLTGSISPGSQEEKGLPHHLILLTAVPEVEAGTFCIESRCHSTELKAFLNHNHEFYQVQGTSGPEANTALKGSQSAPPELSLGHTNPLRIMDFGNASCLSRMKKGVRVCLETCLV